MPSAQITTNAMTEKPTAPTLHPSLQSPPIEDCLLKVLGQAATPTDALHLKMMTQQRNLVDPPSQARRLMGGQWNLKHVRAASDASTFYPFAWYGGGTAATGHGSISKAVARWRQTGSPMRMRRRSRRPHYGGSTDQAPPP